MEEICGTGGIRKKNHSTRTERLSAENTEVGTQKSNHGENLKRIHSQRMVSHNQIKNYLRALLVASIAAQLLYHLVGAEIKLVEVLAFLLAHTASGVASNALQSRMQIADETDNFSLHKKYTLVVIFDPMTTLLTLPRISLKSWEEKG